ncbi:MAG: phosphatidylserine decarboxylase family protein [Candidatus Nitrohelix vancouverensis]|uniref:Phosphatidylserine decarboxylase proenzyme n=1 Tax=Candidatus Nitrohelix vancouverensis TaxID=2705534 RepID=A0A7T0C3Z5_9BACT|nr:MAG: phosphatidylserine decarboxylase family protein [Candidatus Nitrohelix vancouverensis]
MRIPIAKEGYIFIIPLALISALCLAASFYVIGALFTGLFLFVLYFFRDPERSIPSEPNVIVSPADGKVVEIISETDPLLGRPFTRISIFLNVFNVHVNRIPVAGKIKTVKYNEGKFLNAASHKASLDNEQNSLVIDTGNGDILVKQIAGLIARRIVCWAGVGDEYQLGQRFGLIRFGSRVDLLIPEDTNITVSCGDIVKGGTSILGYLK